jgi:hypothetical protein
VGPGTIIFVACMTYRPGRGHRPKHIFHMYDPRARGHGQLNISQLYDTRARGHRQNNIFQMYDTRVPGHTHAGPWSQAR